MSQALDRKHQPRPIRSDLEAVGRGAWINLLGSALGGLGQLGIVYAVTRGLHTAGAGAVFTALAWFAIAVRIGELGVDAGLSRAIPRIRVNGTARDLRRTLSIAVLPALTAGALLGMAMFLLADRMAGWLGAQGSGTDVGTCIRVLSPFVPIAVLLAVVSAATRGFGVMTPSSLVDRGLKPLLQAALIATAIAAGAGVSGTVLAWALPTVAACGIAAAWLRGLVRQSTRQIGSGADDQEPMATARGFWRFTLPRGAAGGLQIVTLSAGTLMVGHFLGVTDAGIYGAAVRMLLIGNVVVLAFMQVTAPKISEVLAAGSVERGTAVYAAATAWQVLLTWPIYLTLGLLGAPLLGLFGGGFSAGSQALAILCAGMLFMTFLEPADVVLLMSGRSGLSLANVGLGCIIAVALNAILDPRMGIAGAAVALAVAVAVRNGAARIQIRGLLGLGIAGSEARAAATCTVACYAAPLIIVRTVADATLTSVVCAVTASTLVYAVALWVLRDRLQLAILVGSLRPNTSAGSRIAGQVPLEVEVRVEDGHRRESGAR